MKILHFSDGMFVFFVLNFEITFYILDIWIFCVAFPPLTLIDYVDILH